MVIAWIQIWEAVSQFSGADQGTFTAMTIVASLFMGSAMVVAPVYWMLVSTNLDKLQEANSESIVSSVVESFNPMSLTSKDNDHPRDAHFFGCGYCSQVFTSKRILEVHIESSHPGMEYKEVLSKMSERFAEVIHNPAVSEGYTLSDVKRHNKKSDCWVVLNGKVYDMTAFLNKHPGGPEPILSWAGRDASRTWNVIHQPAWIAKYASQGIQDLGPVAADAPVPGLSNKFDQESGASMQEVSEVRRRHLEGNVSMASTGISDTQASTALISNVGGN
jgi:hypothetical protein